MFCMSRLSFNTRQNYHIIVQCQIDSFWSLFLAWKWKKKVSVLAFDLCVTLFLVTLASRLSFGLKYTSNFYCIFIAHSTELYAFITEFTEFNRIYASNKFQSSITNGQKITWRTLKIMQYYKDNTPSRLRCVFSLQQSYSTTFQSTKCGHTVRPARPLLRNTAAGSGRGWRARRGAPDNINLARPARVSTQREGSAPGRQLERRGPNPIGARASGRG